MNFALYSSDWTQMSIEYRKLLLYTMRMNDAEKTILKISPTRIVNLKMFANVRKFYILFNVLSYFFRYKRNRLVLGKILYLIFPSCMVIATIWRIKTVLSIFRCIQV